MNFVIVPGTLCFPMSMDRKSFWQTNRECVR